MTRRTAVTLVLTAALLALATCGPRRSGPAGSVAGVSPPAHSWVAREESRPGTSAWKLTTPATHHQIKGYADRVSVSPGQSVRLYVSTTAPRFRATAFRMGWYAGKGARQVWSSPVTTGHHQPHAVMLPATRTVTTRWRPSLTVPTAGWSPGDYLFRLDTVGPSGRAAAGTSGGTVYQSYVPLTVRSSSARGRLVVMNAVTTWQAYNDYGGYNLYTGPGNSASTRSYAVTFDRPYATGNGAGQFLVDELPAIRLAERLGLNLAYLTGIDVAEHPATLAGARGIISLGHDEYWSLSMRRAVTAARDSGSNVAFLGANAVFRHIRLAATGLGRDRLEIDYKDPYADPLLHSDPADVTSDWREPPDPRPESQLTGALYECNPVLAPMVFVSTPSWLFAGSGLHHGSALPDLVGSEYDRARPGAPTPTPLQVLGHSPVTCRGVHSYADFVYYSGPGGAGVVDTGTNDWMQALAGRAGTGPQAVRTRQAVTAVTTNLLRAFAAGPAGAVQPATNNLSSFETYPGDPIAARHDLW